MNHDIPEPGLVPGDLHNLSSLYAVDALEPAERAAFESHLAGCPPCRAEVASYAETTAQLAAAVALEPPPALRTSVLNAIHGTFPLPARPDTATATAQSPGGPVNSAPVTVGTLLNATAQVLVDITAPTPPAGAKAGATH